ncbi:MAG: DUF2917 domain-containing protein [Burkholderiales bacterium]
MKLAMRRVARAEIPRGESLVVTDGEATTLRIQRGCVWITEERSLVDHILVAGQRYTFDRPGTAIATAHDDARVTLVAPRFGARPARVAVGGTTLYERPVWQTIASWVLPSTAPA